MMVGARVGAWAKSGGSMPTARDYNLPLITHMYDAAENLGLGVTDHTVGRWVDCITGTVKTFTIGANSKWEDGAFVRTKALGNFILDIPVLELGTTTTLVFRCDTPAGTTNPRIVGTSNHIIRMEIDVYDSSPNQNPRVYLYSNGSYRTDYLMFGLDFSQFISISYSFGYNGEFFMAYNGGEPHQAFKEYPIDSSHYQAQPLSLNVGAWYMYSSAMDMTLKSVRRYSSVLTASQLSAEFAIDKARFGLT